MGVGFGRSRVADLTFRVFGRTIHPDWFAARQFCRLARKAWEVDIRIIDGGHSILFRTGSTRLSEILSGPETPALELGLLYQSSLKRERSTTLDAAGGVCYQTCFEVERVDPEVFDHLTEEMTLDASSNHLFHRFVPRNRLAPSPISHIRFEPAARGVSIHTFHTFPEEQAIIRTQTLLEPGKPR
jgi:hypothetical protein